MSIEAPPKVLVEKYMIEIAKALNIDYEPDESVFEEERLRKEESKRQKEAVLIDLNDLHSDPMLPPQIPSTSGSAQAPNLPSRGPDAGIVRPIGFDLSNSSLIDKEFQSLNPSNVDSQFDKQNQSPPPNYFDSINTPLSKSSPTCFLSSNDKPESDLPPVPKTLPNTLDNLNQNNGSDESDIDFDDLAKRFESLKKN